MKRSVCIDRYRKFCKKKFEKRKFIALPVFNRLIADEINPNFTHYRRRMVSLNLITVEHGVVKPKKNENAVQAKQ
ncbi:hypothetical protein AB406_1711 [Riemerella anatipestifer]|uniref:Uncharacterized protein n=2 Tax=Riemerella anatipestifer TaxID=34085 RepID=A0A1S7DU66_RIEAN|nr:hypothetical protein AB406_1711 [Riemerella anatipestifer]